MPICNLLGRACPERDLVSTALAIGAATTATGVALTPFVAPVLLGVVGFGATGPVAGVFPVSLFEATSKRSKPLEPDRFVRGCNASRYR